MGYIVHMLLIYMSVSEAIKQSFRTELRIDNLVKKQSRNICVLNEICKYRIIVFQILKCE